jgi:hypothetical protein
MLVGTTLECGRIVAVSLNISIKLNATLNDDVFLRRASV